MKEQVAIYLRLSLEDVDKRTNCMKDESNSIVSQRMLLTRHLDQNPNLCDLPRLEFCDDGSSGTNFDRPDFARMIECAKRGEISCIMVKDFSRFGRDYLEVGDYLEHIFPFLGIRFISVNDHYDSSKHEGKTIGMDIAFKNLVYDYYSKDLSKKVKSAMGMRQRAARYVSTAPYGYQPDPKDKHHLILDMETAPVIRRIFTEIIAGKSCTLVAKGLNEDRIPTPSQHKGRTSNSTFPQWTHRTVHNIIENMKYTGAMVNHTRESRFIRDKSQCRVPREEWFIRENAHEAIVTHEEYDQAQAAIQQRKKSVRSAHDQSDRVYYCGHCGAKLEKANGTVFACPSHRYHDGSLCENVRWRKSALEDVIFEALKRQIRITRMEVPQRKRATKRQAEHLERQLTLLKAQHDACGREKFTAYENYREGRLTADEYIASRDAITKKQADLKLQLEECKMQCDAHRKEARNAESREAAIGKMTGLTDAKLREHLYDAIEHILVYDSESIEIVWKFDEMDRK